ncbi:MAG: hypothetical protein JWM80_590 [Cyanobacteria bacterium RYN_339]|nr:hypothetical protein [Cyanobacteria bacterium RYN_339]
MQIAAANNSVPAPVRTARAAAAATPVKAVLDSYQKANEAPPSKISQAALWSAGASLAAGVILGVMGRPGMAIACALSAIVDGAVAWFTRK